MSWLRCLSLANLCMIGVWAQLLAPGPDVLYFQDGPPTQVRYWAALALLGMLTAVFWLVDRVVNDPALRGVIGLLAAMEVAKAILLAFGESYVEQFFGAMAYRVFGSPALLVLSLACIWAALAAIVRFAAGWRRLTSNLLMACSFIVPVTVAQGVWYGLRAPVRNTRAAIRSNPGAGAKRRAVWMVFDEMDERIAFSARRAGFVLPALDRFRRESIVLADAESPANATAISVPSLVMGRPRSELREFGTRPDIFSRAKGLGLRTGVAGWYFQYCRVLADRLDECENWPMSRQLNTYSDRLGGVIHEQARGLFESSQFSIFDRSLAVEAHSRMVAEQAEAAARMASRADLDLVFLHLGVPHSPYVFDAAANGTPEGYLGNLQLADRVFGKIREAMEAAGVWERTTVLVTSDHGFRGGPALGYGGADRHVPFMLKTDRPVGLDRGRKFGTIATGELLLGLLAPEGPWRSAIEVR